MPVATREAMLEAVRAGERIITGAYVDGQGGVCPMLAAHRRGGRTDFISFACSWDRFTRAGRRKRDATPREVAILVAQLEDSLLSSEGLELDRAIREHHQLVARSKRARRLAPRRRLPDSADPSGEIIARRLRLPGGRFLGDNLGRRSRRGSRSPVPSRG